MLLPPVEQADQTVFHLWPLGRNDGIAYRVAGNEVCCHPVCSKSSLALAANPAPEPPATADCGHPCENTREGLATPRKRGATSAAWLRCSRPSESRNLPARYSRFRRHRELRVRGMGDSPATPNTQDSKNVTIRWTSPSLPEQSRTGPRCQLFQESVVSM